MFVAVLQQPRGRSNSSVYLPMNVNIYNGMLFNLKKERNSERCYNMNVLYLENIMLSEIKQAQKNKFYMILFVQEMKNGELFKGYRVSGVQDKKVVDISCKTL